MSCDLWQVTCDKWWGVNILSKFQLVRSCQNDTLPGGHRLLSEYFQSCESKQRYDKATDDLLCSNLLFWFSGQAGDEYHGNPPNILVICQIFLRIFVPGYWAPSLSPAKLFTAPGCSCFVYFNPRFVSSISFSFFVSNSCMATKFIFVWALVAKIQTKLSHVR